MFARPVSLAIADGTSTDAAAHASANTPAFLIITPPNRIDEILLAGALIVAILAREPHVNDRGISVAAQTRREARVQVQVSSGTIARPIPESYETAGKPA